MGLNLSFVKVNTRGKRGQKGTGEDEPGAPIRRQGTGADINQTTQQKQNQAIISASKQLILADKKQILTVCFRSQLQQERPESRDGKASLRRGLAGVTPSVLSHSFS